MSSMPSLGMSPGRRVLFECTPFYYPFGNTEAKDFLQILSLKERERSDTVKILLLGCGDLRHALTTATGERGSHCLEIHLNDVNPSIIARNVLILSILTSPTFNSEEDEDFKFLWDIWYNALWSEATSANFRERVTKLIDGALPSNINIPRPEDREVLVQVWKLWLSMFDLKGNMKGEFIKEVLESRKSVIIRGWLKLSGADILYEPKDDSTPLREATHGLAAIVEQCLYEGILPDEGSKSKIRQELVYYFEHGYCFTGKQSSRTRNTSLNPTLLDPVTKKWFVHYKLNPFEGFFTLFKQNISQVNAKAYKSEHAILLKNSQAILRNITETYRNDCLEAVKFTFHLSEALEFCLYGSSETFDIIDSSNLSDNIGLANILVSARNRLSKNNPDAIITTESMKWFSIAETVSEYVQASLGAPFSMIPTVYGLSLVNTVQLGATKSRLLPLPAPLIWRRCPEYENVTFTPSAVLKKCFAKILPVCLRDFEWGDCGLLSYTLFTLHLIACGLMQRFGLSPNEVNMTQLLPSPDTLSGTYRLQIRTLDFWAKGRRTSKFTSVVDVQNVYPAGFESFECTHAKYLTRATPALQLLLVPKKHAPNFEAARLLRTEFIPDVHVIDTFTFRFIRKKDDPESLEAVHVTFLLPEETTVELTHVAVIVDVRNLLLLNYKTSMFYLGDVKNLTKEPFNQPYPIQFKSESSSREQATETKLKMIECLEFEGKYVVKFEDGKQAAPNFHSDQEPPCESAHSLKISWKNATQSFEFSHPFMANDITSTVQAQDGTLTVTLPKAIDEPWPFQFKNTRKKIDTSSLKPWRETKLASLPVHLGTQFKMAEMSTFDLSSKVVKSTPLNEVRQAIQAVFSTVFESSIDEVFALKAGWTERVPMWYLRAHRPIRVGPNGEPFLAITASDHEMVRQLVKHDRMDANNAFEFFARIVPNDAQVSCLVMPTPEGVQLFRYLLRLNSTKVEITNAWQKRNLPKRNDLLFMFATYLSPLYGDGELPGGPVKSFVPLQSNMDPFQQAQPPLFGCETCGKRTDLKKCSRCKSVSYCGAACQKADWPHHKSSCKSLP